MLGPTALLDACVLYPAPLRDLLMHLALADLFRPRWSAHIHEEWIQNVLRNRPDLTRTQLNRTRVLMDQHARDAVVTAYVPLIDKITLPDSGDRHVLAAAIKGEAKVIVTFNLADFPSTELFQYNLEAVSPDDFLADLLERYPHIFLASVRRLRLSLKKPPMSPEEYFHILSKQKIPKTVATLKENIFRF